MIYSWLYKSMTLRAQGYLTPHMVMQPSQHIVCDILQKSFQLWSPPWIKGIFLSLSLGKPLLSAHQDAGLLLSYVFPEALVGHHELQELEPGHLAFGIGHLAK